jgi:hypothetical protein
MSEAQNGMAAESAARVAQESGESKRKTILDRVKENPMAAVGIVSFTVASALLGFVINVLSVYSSAHSKEISGLKAEFSADKGVLAAQNSTLEKSLAACKEEQAQAEEQNKTLREGQRGGAAFSDSNLQKQLSSQGRALETANRRIQELIRENESLQLRNTQVQLQGGARAEEVNKIIQELQDKNKLLQDQLNAAKQPGASASREQRITFEIAGATSGLGKSDDQITIAFSDQSSETSGGPDFGDSVLQEFTFSAREFGSTTPRVQFTRKVRDTGFLNAQFIRVFNHGTGGWDGRSLSITLDGKAVLTNVSLAPRKGPKPDGRIESYNRERWAQRSYWEARLPDIRQDR